MRVWIAVAKGSGRLTAAFWDWVSHGWLTRLGGVVLAALFIKGLSHTWLILGCLAVAWVVAAVALGLAKPSRDTETDGDEDSDSGDQEEGDEEAEDATPAEPEPLPDLTRDETAEYLRQLLGPEGGVHLATLARALTKASGGRRWETRDARALVTRVGIRVRDGVRVPGGGVREGVHRADVPPATPPEREGVPESVVAAGEGGNNNGNNVVREKVGEGGVITRHPGDTRRYKVAARR
ncbi:hypothetical protein ACFV3E_24640 [Streptomyces sp. NPDC059718]